MTAEGEAAKPPAAQPASEDQPAIAASASAPETEAPAQDEEKDADGAAVPVGAATAATPPSPPSRRPTAPATPRPSSPRARRRPPPVRRPAPAAQPLRSNQPPSRRPAPAVTADEPSGRRTGIVVAGVAAGLILVVIALLAIFTGGDDGTPKQASTPTTQTPPGTPASQSTASGNDDNDNKSSTANRADTKVAVLNGTTVSGLAGTIDTSLTEAGYTEAQTPTNYTDQARSASVIFYNGSENRTAAIEIRKLLDISDVQPIETAASQLAPGADVVVVVGADQTP